MTHSSCRPRKAPDTLADISGWGPFLFTHGRLKVVVGHLLFCTHTKKTKQNKKQKIPLWSSVNSLQALQAAQNQGPRSEVFVTCIPVLSALARLQTSAKTIRPGLINGEGEGVKTGALIDFGSIWMKHKLRGCAEHLNQL